MIPLIKTMSPAYARAGLMTRRGSPRLAQAFGDNGTAIGASANLMVAAPRENGVLFCVVTSTLHALPLIVPFR